MFCWTPTRFIAYSKSRSDSPLYAKFWTCVCRTPSNPKEVSLHTALGGESGLASVDGYNIRRLAHYFSRIIKVEHINIGLEERLRGIFDCPDPISQRSQPMSLCTTHQHRSCSCQPLEWYNSSHTAFGDNLASKSTSSNRRLQRRPASHYGT